MQLDQWPPRPIRPVAERRIASGLVAVNWAQTIMTMTMIGTHRNMPAKPQSPPHTASETRIASGLRFKRAAHEPRVEHAADGELDHAQPEQGREERPEAAELDQDEQGWEQHADERADERDIVHHEHDQRPEAGVLAPDRGEHEPGQERREHAHQGLDPQIALHPPLDVAAESPGRRRPCPGPGTARRSCGRSSPARAA